MSSSRCTLEATGTVKITFPTGLVRECHTVLTAEGTEVWEKYEPEFGYDHYIDDIDDDSITVNDYCEDVEDGTDYMNLFTAQQLTEMMTPKELCEYGWEATGPIEP